MTVKFSNLRLNMKPESQLRVQAKTEQLLAGTPFHALEQARRLSKKLLVKVLDIDEPSIAKIEKRTDMYLSTLRTHIQAMGGELEVVAHFPCGSISINNFSELEVGAGSGSWRNTEERI